MRSGWSIRLAMGFLLAAGAVAPAQAASKIILPRPGQVGIGVQGGYGTLLEGGDLGDLFSDGGSFAVRMRYRMRFERAIGISFESQTFDARLQGAVADTVAKTLTLIMTGFDIYQMFDTREKTTKMLSVGIGLARPSVELTSNETSFPEDGFYVTRRGRDRAILLALAGPGT